MPAMTEYTDELNRFMRAIVQGTDVSPQIDTIYQNYSLDIAIEIYRNNYRGNLHDALTGAYPVILQLVGDEFFRYLTRSYIGQYPSVSANLYHYGEQMSVFLQEFPPAQALPYLPDVAVLEWTCQIAYFATDEPNFALDKLALIPAEQHPNLILHTACHVLRSNYPLTAIWQAHQPGADIQINLASGGSIALVSRLANIVQVSELSEADACWLQRIQVRDTLGLATEATLALHPDFNLQATLLALLKQGVLTGFHLESTS